MDEEEELMRLFENRQELIDDAAAKIQRGLEQSERGELIHEDELDAFLAKLKAGVG